MTTISMSAVLALRNFHDKGSSALWCGLEAFSSEPGCEFVRVHVDPNDADALAKDVNHRCLGQLLPLIKGLLHATAVRGEGNEAVIDFRPIPGDRDEIRLFHEVPPESADESTSAAGRKGGAV